MLEVQQLSYRYLATETPALTTVSLRLERGEVLLLTGANGAGKSTLCLALAGFVPHHFQGEMEGEVRLNGRSLRETPLGEWVRQVGLVFQNPFNQITGARMTVFEEVAFGLENLGVPPDEIRQRVAETLARLDIAPLAERSPYALSGGQMQRVAIASILALRPEVLVLDEPTAQLDPQGTAEVFRVLRDLAAQGTTVVLATHQIEQAAAFVTRAVVLAEGRVVADGPAGTVLGDPALDGWGVLRPLTARVAQAGGWPQPWPITPGGWDGTHHSAPHGHPALPGSHPAPESSLPGDLPMVPPTPVVAEGLRFVYPSGVVALQDVGLQAHPGTITALLGENGAGKSTLSKVLMGLLQPEAGRLRLGDWEVTAPRFWERRGGAATLAARIGYVFQNPDEQLFKSTVWDEVAFGPRNLGMRDEALEEAVRRALALTELEPLADEHPYDLRPDQRRWVAIASVLAMGPPALIVDEPTTGQDVRGRARLASLLRRLRTSGHTLIVITHDMAFAAELADQVVVMAGGTVLASGTPDALFGNETLLDRAGLQAPPALRLSRQLGLTPLITDAALLAAVQAQG